MDQYSDRTRLVTRQFTAVAVAALVFWTPACAYQPLESADEISVDWGSPEGGSDVDVVEELSFHYRMPDGSVDYYFDHESREVVRISYEDGTERIWSPEEFSGDVEATYPGLSNAILADVRAVEQRLIEVGSLDLEAGIQPGETTSGTSGLSDPFSIELGHQPSIENMRDLSMTDPFQDIGDIQLASFWTLECQTAILVATGQATATALKVIATALLLIAAVWAIMPVAGSAVRAAWSTILPRLRTAMGTLTGHVTGYLNKLARVVQGFESPGNLLNAWKILSATIVAIWTLSEDIITTLGTGVTSAILAYVNHIKNDLDLIQEDLLRARVICTGSPARSDYITVQCQRRTLTGVVPRSESEIRSDCRDTIARRVLPGNTYTCAHYWPGGFGSGPFSWNTAQVQRCDDAVDDCVERTVRCCGRETTDPMCHDTGLEAGEAGAPGGGAGGDSYGPPPGSGDDYGSGPYGS